MGEAKGEPVGEDEFEIVLAAEGRGDVDGLSSMPESFDCSVCGFVVVDEVAEDDTDFKDVVNDSGLLCCCCCC